MTRYIEGLAWPGGEHDFALTLGPLKALQDHCDAGPEYILNAIATGTYRQEMLFEVLRQGLIGAGMAQDQARKLVYDIADTVPLRELVVPAQMVLTAALVGVPDDPAGKLGGGDPSPTPPAASGDSASSTEPAQP